MGGSAAKPSGSPAERCYVALIRSVFRGVGAHLPKRIMTNDDLARRVDTSDAWIRERTGIEQRHIAEPKELTSDLGITQTFPNTVATIPHNPPLLPISDVCGACFEPGSPPETPEEAGRPPSRVDAVG